MFYNDLLVARRLLKPETVAAMQTFRLLDYGWARGGIYYGGGLMIEQVHPQTAQPQPQPHPYLPSASASPLTLTHARDPIHVQVHQDGGVGAVWLRDRRVVAARRYSSS